MISCGSTRGARFTFWIGFFVGSLGISQERCGKSFFEPTDWVSPTNVVYKNNKVRITIDYTRLNQSVKREIFPILPVEETLANIKDAAYFTKLDANSGFYQIDLTEESKKLTTFLTPFGRFYFNRLPMGIACAPEHFEARIKKNPRKL